MKRGDLVTITVSENYGKTRPALIVQADPFEALASVTVLPLTGEFHYAPLFRVTIEPGKKTGLDSRMQVMVDKATTVPRDKISARIGQLDLPTLEAVDKALRWFLGL